MPLPITRQPLLVMLIAIFLGLWAPSIAIAQDGLAIPAVTATAVYAFDPATDEEIMAFNADEHLAIGSVTKVATALVAVQHLELDREVVILSQDMVPDGYSAMGLQPGDTLTVEQLLTGLMVESGGDAASALARTAGEDICACDDVTVAHATFVEAMNAFAAANGLANTQFANPDGADDPNAWSTARDVAAMFAILIENPVLKEMGAMPSYSFTSIGPEQTPYDGVSTNQFVGQHNLTSAKTGSETNAGGCIVFARTSPDGATTEVIAVLGADLEYDETWTPVVDARWDDSVAVMNAIDTGWTPGQFIVAEPTTAPIAFQSQDETADENPANDTNVNPNASTDDEAAPVHNDMPDVLDSVHADRGALAPVVVGMSAVGVLVLAAIVSWVRPAVPRQQ